MLQGLNKMRKGVSPQIFKRQVQPAEVLSHPRRVRLVLFDRLEHLDAFALPELGQGGIFGLQFLQKTQKELLGILLPSRVVGEPSVGFNEHFGIDWTLAAGWPVHQAKHGLAQSFDDLAISVIADYILPQDSNKVQNLQNRVHVTRISLVLYAHEFGLVHVLALDNHFKG